METAKLLTPGQLAEAANNPYDCKIEVTPRSKRDGVGMRLGPPLVVSCVKMKEGSLVKAWAKVGLTSEYFCEDRPPTHTYVDCMNGGGCDRDKEGKALRALQDEKLLLKEEKERLWMAFPKLVVNQPGSFSLKVDITLEHWITGGGSRRAWEKSTGSKVLYSQFFVISLDEEVSGSPVSKFTYLATVLNQY